MKELESAPEVTKLWWPGSRSWQLLGSARLPGNRLVCALCSCGNEALTPWLPRTGHRCPNGGFGRSTTAGALVQLFPALRICPTVAKSHCGQCKHGSTAGTLWITRLRGGSGKQPLAGLALAAQGPPAAGAPCHHPWGPPCGWWLRQLSWALTVGALSCCSPSWRGSSFEATSRVFCSDNPKVLRVPGPAGMGRSGTRRIGAPELSQEGGCV